MIVYAVYIIAEGGRPILSEYFQSTRGMPKDVLIGGLLTAFQQMIGEIHGSDMKTVEIEGLSYHIRSFGFISVALVTDIQKPPELILQALGLRFINNYGELLMRGDFNLELLEPFRATIREIVYEESDIDYSKSIQPSKKLTPGEVFSLPSQLQPTALALISLESGTIKEIAQESGKSIKITKKNLTSLQEKGFVGTKIETSQVKYFCSI